MKRILGIDVGGSGVKGAIVNVQTGHLLSQRYRVKTPRPATPRALAAAIARVAAHFSWKGRIGVGMPGPLKDGKLMLARNLDRTWAGIRAHVIYSDVTGLPVACIQLPDVSAFGAAVAARALVEPGLTVDSLARQWSPARSTITPDLNAPRYAELLARYLQHFGS